MRKHYAYALALFASVVVVGGETPSGRQLSGRVSTAPVSITIRSQRIIFGGPHRFREVKAALMNTGEKPINILGRKGERDFAPVGEALIFDTAKDTWTLGRPTLTAAEIADDAPDRYTLRPGKTLEFTRTFNPSFGGKKLRIEAYYAVDRTSAPVRVTSDAFDLK